VFARKLRVEYVKGSDAAQPTGAQSCPLRQTSPVREPCPVKWIDNFAMRNFTNSAIFDDTLPVGDGVLEAGFRVPLAELEAAMDDWFHRKGYLKPEDRLVVTET
jgi:hypothetical protein